MTAKRSTVDVLEAIDATLADYETDRREAWIEENLNHPGQMHVAIANRQWYQSWLDGDITDDEAQTRAENDIAEVDQYQRTYADRVACWYCGFWARPGRQMHDGCRRNWAAAKRDRPRGATDSIADPLARCWTRCLRSDGTGWGGGWDEENWRELPPDVGLVDGVGITVGPHVFQMANLK